MNSLNNILSVLLAAIIGARGEVLDESHPLGNFHLLLFAELGGPSCHIGRWVENWYRFLQSQQKLSKCCIICILVLSSPHKMVEVPIQKILMKCDAVEGQKRNVIPAMVEVSRYLPSAGTSHH